MRFFLMFIMGLTLMGCSNVKELGTAVDVPEQKPNSLVAFDQKLAAATDEETTQEAVSFFLDRVVQNLVPNSDTESGISLQSTDRREQLIQTVTASEMFHRGIPSASGRLQSASPAITCATLAAVLSESYTAHGTKRTISEEQVRQTQAAVRRNLPHLATSDSSDMSTLEASVLAYYMLTGDTGGDEVLALAASENDLVTFIAKIHGAE